MADMNYDDFSVAAALGQLAQAQQLMATRPQKSLVKTVATSTPRALEDMIMRRNMIGANNQRLLDALKGRETFGYNVGAGLANLAPVSGYGDWGVNALRAFGGAMNRPIDATIAREQVAQEQAQKNLEAALAIDKAMGETQVQEQKIDYEDLPYGKVDKKDGGGSVGDSEQLVRQEVSGQTLADVYKTVSKNPLVFSNLAPIYQDANSRALKSGIEQQGVQNLGRSEFQYLQSIMPKGFTTAINTAKEQEMMRPLTTAFAQGTGTAKTSAITNFYNSLYDEYAAQAAIQGIKMPISKQEYINSRLAKGREYNPAYFTGQSRDMYKSDNGEKIEGAEGGFIINGYRFKGGDVHDKNNWEAIL